MTQRQQADQAIKIIKELRAGGGDKFLKKVLSMLPKRSGYSISEIWLEARFAKKAFEKSREKK